MKLILFTASLFLLLIQIISAQQLTIQQPIRFLALGDSYTIGEGVATADNWPNQFFDSLQARGLVTDSLQIIARTGWRVDNLKQGMRAAQLDSNWTLVALLIGVNNQFQSGSVADYRPQFGEMLRDAIALAGGNTAQVMVLSIPDYAFTPFGQSFQNPGLITLDIDSFNTANRQITQSYGVPYFDITPISRLGLQQPSLVASDGLHPSGEMYSEWVKLILEEVMNSTNVSEYDLSNSQDRLWLDQTSSLLYVKSEQLAKIKIWDFTGKLVFEKKLMGSHIFPFSASAGIYMYEIKNQSNRLKRGKIFQSSKN